MGGDEQVNEKQNKKFNFWAALRGGRKQMLFSPVQPLCPDKPFVFSPLRKETWPKEVDTGTWAIKRSDRVTLFWWRNESRSYGTVRAERASLIVCDWFVFLLLVVIAMIVQRCSSGDVLTSFIEHKSAKQRIVETNKRKKSAVGFRPSESDSKMWVSP